MSSVYKLFSKIITRWITKKLDENQAGFRLGYSTVDHLQTVNQIIEKTEEINPPLYLAFVDYTKAFDTVEHTSVLQALERQGIEHKYIRILRNLYNEAHAKVTIKKECHTFKLERGVWRGDPILPKLFTSLLEDTFWSMNWGGKYGDSLDGSRLSNLRFAEDIVLFARKPGNLQTMLQALSNSSRKTGLEMNMNKTKSWQIDNPHR